jgi:hypothetical protein
MEGPRMTFVTYCWSRIVSFWHLIHNKSFGAYRTFLPIVP